LSTQAHPEDDTSSASEAGDLTSTPAASSTGGAGPNPAITLLQLKNGWIYGLTDYWAEGDDLHYVTNYGGKNSIPLDPIDLATTMWRNSEGGVEFSLYRKPRSTAQYGNQGNVREVRHEYQDLPRLRFSR
jgi:hypothetical protein